MTKNMSVNKDNKTSIVEHNAFKLGFVVTNCLILGFMVLRLYLNEPIGDLLTITLSNTLVVSIYRGYHMSSKRPFTAALIMGLITMGLLVATLLSQYGVY